MASNMQKPDGLVILPIETLPGALAAVLALSVPALVRSIEARRWSAAVVSLAALLLSGTYSVTAALGSAAGGRQNAATAETASTDARKRLQGAYDAAKAELDALRPSRAVGELEALVAGAKPEQRPDAVNTAAPAIKAVPAPVFSSGVQARSEPAPGVQAPDLLALVTAAGGSLRTTTRRLGVQLGRPSASVHGELRRLAGAGLIALNADRRGTLITLATGRPN
jgi:hypothetical protein